MPGQGLVLAECMFHPDRASRCCVCQVLVSMRSFVVGLLAMCLAVSGWSGLHADQGIEAERIEQPSALDAGHGAVVISIRSSLWLDDPLDVYFLREGGDIANDADVVRFVRKQGFFSIGNDTTKYKIRAYQLRPGTYRLVAHGVGCPKIPAVNERCLIEEPGIFGSLEYSRPSRGYPDIAPTFEVRSGEVTYAGDFALTDRNTIEWSQIPAEELRGLERRFARLRRAPEPIIPGEYRLRYGLFPRSYSDDAGRKY